MTENIKNLARNTLDEFALMVKSNEYQSVEVLQLEDTEDYSHVVITLQKKAFRDKDGVAGIISVDLADLLRRNLPSQQNDS